MTLPTIVLDETHDPECRSWVASANRPGTDFPVQNLPMGVVRPREAGGEWRVGVAIGDEVFDLRRAAGAGLLDRLPAVVVEACAASDLARYMRLERRHRVALRRRLHGLLVEGATVRTAASDCLRPVNAVEIGLPVAIGDYTDFYASVFHATNVGRMMRPDHPLLPNYKFVPVGYHGRASSIVPSETPIRRPAGQTKPEGAERPVFGPSRRLDYEVEVGLFVGPGNRHGEPIPLDEAENHAVGLCLVNDWSARDVQAWEYQPLGPFLAKSFASTLSPWVVTLEALEPFRCPAFERAAEDPKPLEYLYDERDQREGGLAIEVEMHLRTRRMKTPARLSRASFRDSYWTAAQMVAHHSSNGCNLRPGDLLGSGTISGATSDSLGSMMELTLGGRQPLSLPSGETRAFLEDGDEVIERGRCTRAGSASIGFGQAAGTIK